MNNVVCMMMSILSSDAGHQSELRQTVMSAARLEIVIIELRC